MRPEDIQIHTYGVATPYKRICSLEVKVSAGSLFASPPTLEQVNDELRLKASEVYANAVIDVEYQRGISFTSYKVLKAVGTAVILDSADIDCPFCAEPIKRAAKKCKHCGSDVAS